jgi:hypothetical protein
MSMTPLTTQHTQQIFFHFLPHDIVAIIIGDCENFSLQIGHNFKVVVVNAVIKKTSQKIIIRIKVRTIWWSRHPLIIPSICLLKFMELWKFVFEVTRQKLAALAE